MAEVIALPLFSEQAIRIIGNPNPPSNPPSIHDITTALHYSRVLLNENAKKRVSDDDVVQNEVYKNKLLFKHDGDAVPPWFNGAMELLLEPIKADLQVLKDDVQVLKDDLQVLKGDMQVVKGDLRVVKAVQSNVWKFTSRDHNLSAGVGEDAKLEVVPFTNGQDPTKAPHNLPALKCINDVRILSAQNRDKYYRGYYNTPHQLPLVVERTQKILLAIGANDVN